MLIDKIKSRNNVGEINVIIEIAKESTPIKYEMDKESGAMFVDRFMQTAMFYPCNYGFVPHTLSEDGDPLDVLVMSHFALAIGSVIRTRAIAVLMMEDEKGFDEKIIAVPISKLDPAYDLLVDLSDVPILMKDRIEHFFMQYKALEQGKWVKMIGWDNKKKADILIEQSIKRNAEVLNK